MKPETLEILRARWQRLRIYRYRGSGRVRFSQAGITFPSGPVGPHFWSISHDRKRNPYRPTERAGRKA